MKKILLMVALVALFSGCSKAELKCDNSCDVTREANGDTSFSCTACSLEVSGKDMSIINIDLPKLPSLPNRD